MKFLLKSACLISFVFVLSIAYAGRACGAGEYEEAIKVTEIKKTTTTTDGSRIQYPITDKPEVTVALVEIAPGVRTGWHYHTIPVYAYVLSGTLTVEMDKQERYVFNEGEAIIEVVDRLHNGVNLGEKPVKLIVFYTGKHGSPNAIKDENVTLTER